MFLRARRCLSARGSPDGHPELQRRHRPALPVQAGQDPHPFAPGGSNDTVGRYLADNLQKRSASRSWSRIGGGAAGGVVGLNTSQIAR